MEMAMDRKITASHTASWVWKRAACALSVLAFMSAAHAETTLEKIQRTGVMTAANSFEYAPFGFVEDGKNVGLDVDLTEEVGRRMGVKVTFQKIDFAGLIAALQSGRVDILATAMTWTPERAQRILFSEPYYDGGIGAAYNVNGVKIVKIDDLVGKRIGFQIGSSGERYLKEHITPEQAASMKSYNSLPFALLDLDAGRIDAVVQALPAARYAMRNMPKLHVTDVWDSRTVGMNTRPADQSLMDEINKALVAIKADGTYDKLVAKWFGASEEAKK
jgi:polar amino acid transport system substrate-binding protein